MPQHTLAQKPQGMAGAGRQAVAGCFGGLESDRAVGFTVLGRCLGGAVGLHVTLFLMTRFMSPVLQGYYYTFGSVLALAIFFELGLSARPDAVCQP